MANPWQKAPCDCFSIQGQFRCDTLGQRPVSSLAQSCLRNDRSSSPELYTWGCGHVEPCVFIQNHSLILIPFFKVRACSWVE